jgi:hypothetical protein
MKRCPLAIAFSSLLIWLGIWLALASSASDHRPLHEVPGFVPNNAQNFSRLLDIGRQQHVDGQRLEQIGEATAGLSSRQSYLSHAVLWARHARRLCMRAGEEVAAVEVAPRPFGQVTVDACFSPALGAGKPLARRATDMNFL